MTPERILEIENALEIASVEETEDLANELVAALKWSVPLEVVAGLVSQEHMGDVAREVVAILRKAGIDHSDIPMNEYDEWDRDALGELIAAAQLKDAPTTTTCKAPTLLDQLRLRLIEKGKEFEGKVMTRQLADQALEKIQKWTDELVGARESCFTVFPRKTEDRRVLSFDVEPRRNY